MKHYEIKEIADMYYNSMDKSDVIAFGPMSYKIRLAFIAAAILLLTVIYVDEYFKRRAK